ncbi:MAG: hypothetical protein AAF569_03665 [Pseudomonadota bacterium]
MDKVKGVTAGTMDLRQRKKRNWWDDDDADTFENKWMTGPAAGNANASTPLSMIGQSKTDKDAILISQQNRFDGQSVRAAKSNPYTRANTNAPKKPEHNGEQYTFAFVAESKIDTEA